MDIDSRTYVFPAQRLRGHYPASRLLAVLHLAVRAMKERRSTARARRVYCAVSHALNVEGSIWPAFRPRVPFPGGPTSSQFDSDHSNDIQVLDLHWLWASGYPPKRARPAAQPLFKGEQFNWAAAEELAAFPAQMDNKIKMVGLMNRWSVPLLAFRSKAIKEAMREIDEDVRAFNAELEDRAEWQHQLRTSGAVAKQTALFRAARIAALRMSIGGRLPASLPAVAVEEVMRAMGVDVPRGGIKKQLGRLRNSVHRPVEEAA